MRSTLVHPLILLLVPWCLGHITADPEIIVFDHQPEHLQPTATPKDAKEDFVEEETGVCTVEDEDEEIKTCHEEVRNYVPMILRSDWNQHGKGQQALRMTKPAEFVVISDGGEGCKTKKACLANLLAERSGNLSAPCDVKENFYVGEDGQVYEGRGWEVAPYWYLEGMRIFSVTVKFMGRHDKRAPNERALRAFHSTLALGVWMGKLSPDYKIVSIDQVTSGEKCSGEALRDSVKEWEGWVNDSVPTSRWEHHENDPLTLATRRTWKSASGRKRFESSIKPVEYVLLNNILERCDSREECSSQLRSLQETQLVHFGDLLDNFYIGEDGSVYEGRGWGVLPHWHVEKMLKSYVSVSFLGTFQSELPSRRALGAFKALIQTGIRLREISPSFQLSSLRLIYNDSVFLGDALKLHAEKWTPWAKELDAMTSQERLDDNLVPLIKRSRSKFDIKPGKKVLVSDSNLPVDFVIINEGGELCFDVNECTKIMTSERDKYSDTYGDLLDNFYVGSDGMVYEGRGWKKLPPFHLKHLKNSYITVKFLGSFTKTKPNNLTLQAFHSFLQLGVELGKISPSYHIYSLRHIYNDSTFLGDALSEYMEGLPHWSNELTVNDDYQLESQGLLPIVSRDEWNASSLGKTLDVTNSSIRYVFVGETRDRCFSRAQCVLQMKSEQHRGIRLYGSLTDHFYVGDDGSVYEGLGWAGYPLDSDSKMQGNAIFVRFFGQYNNSTPSELALAAFNRLIIYGLNTDNLLEDYGIISMRSLCNCSQGLGNALHQDLEKWHRYMSDHDPNKFSLSVPYVRSLIVLRDEWNPLTGAPFRSTARNVERADYVIFFQEGERCFNREQCENNIRNTQSTKTGRTMNFFVADDGRLYEGSGWENDPSLKSSCPDCSIIAVSYVGNFGDHAPSAEATEAFNFLMTWGVRVGTISPEYKLISIGQICNNFTSPGDDALSNGLKEWKHWSDEINLTLDCHILYGHVIPPNTWGASKPIRGFERQGRASFIFVRDGRERCYTQKQCTALMVKEHAHVQRQYGVLENFYVGDDGNVFEGRGWKRRPQYEFQSTGTSLYDDNDYMDSSGDDEMTRYATSINVLFFGRFDNESPSTTARAAFKNLIVKKGIESGFLDRAFKLRFVPDGTYSINVGKELKRNLNLLLQD